MTRPVALDLAAEVAAAHASATLAAADHLDVVFSSGGLGRQQRWRVGLPRGAGSSGGS